MTKILILPGWSYSIEKWKHLEEELTEKRLSFEILKIPGLHTNITKPWTLEDYVQWLKKTIDQRENNDIILLGHSNGGRIALAFAVKYPTLYQKLILIDSAGIHHNEARIRLKRLFFKYLAKSGKKLTSSQRLKNLLYKIAREKDYKEANPILQVTMKNLINTDLGKDLEKITNPTLIIWGKLDKVTPLSDAKLIHSKIGRSKLLIISKAKHSPQFTHVQSVSEEINKFISQDN